MTTYWQPHQVEQLRAIGLRLQQERERQSIILEDVSAKTRIRVALLQGIEAAEINRLPEPVYVRGFIRRFEETLGLPGGELSGQLTLEPTILGNVDPLTTYPPTPAKPDPAAAAKATKSEAKPEIKREPAPAPTFRKAPVVETEVAAEVSLVQPIAANGLETETKPSIEALPLKTAADIKPVDIRPADIKPAEPKAIPTDANQLTSQSVTESKARVTPIVAPIAPSDPWADEPAAPTTSPTDDRASQSPDIRIVPPAKAEFELAGERTAATTLLPMPQPRQFAEPEPMPWRPIALGLGLVSLLGLVSWGALNLSKPTVVNQPPIETPSPTPTPLAAAPKPTPTKPAAPVSITVDFKQNAWIQVETDGKLAYEGEIPKGGRKNWTAQKEIFFRTGLSNVVWVAVNGSPSKQFNTYAGPKDQTFVPTSR